MFSPQTWLAIGGAIVSRTIAAVCYKFSAQQQTRRRVLFFFLIGLSFGFFNPVCVFLAMKGNHPNLVIAAIGSIGSVFFVLVINRVFKEKLTPRQWLAILIIFAGTILLRIGKKPEPPSDDRSLESPRASSRLFEDRLCPEVEATRSVKFAACVPRNRERATPKGHRKL